MKNLKVSSKTMTLSKTRLGTFQLSAGLFRLCFSSIGLSFSNIGSKVSSIGLIIASLGLAFSSFANAATPVCTQSDLFLAIRVLDDKLTPTWSSKENKTVATRLELTQNVGDDIPETFSVIIKSKSSCTLPTPLKIVLELQGQRSKIESHLNSDHNHTDKHDAKDLAKDSAKHETAKQEAIKGEAPKTVYEGILKIEKEASIKDLKKSFEFSQVPLRAHNNKLPESITYSKIRIQIFGTLSPEGSPVLLGEKVLNMPTGH